jgi:hypothetical protein
MAKQAAKEVAKKQTLEQWWAEEADRLNQFATSLQSVAVKLPEREERDFSEWESLVDEEYRAFCPGVSPPDNSCPPSNKGDGSRVQNQGRRVRFGTITKVALDNMRATGGFSVHPITGGSPTTGYMVSVKPEAEVVYDSIDSVNEAAFRDFYRQNKETFKSNPNLHFGGWVDTNTGKVYFDLSARYDNVREAVNDAKATNQLAIWHLDEGREIRQEDYDARREQGRSQATRAVRLPRRTGRRRGAGLQGDGGGVSGVRPQGHGRQAVRTTAVSAGRRRSGPVSGRAFCPGVSPPDNSCSPANKGAGGGRSSAIKRPEPDWDPSVTTGDGDPRGALTGHSESQRQNYAEDTAKWLSDRGVELSVQDDGNGPPTVDAMHAIMRGVEKAESLGIEVPDRITVRGDLPPATFAAFSPRTGEIFVSHDLTSDVLRFSIENRFNTGDLRDPDSSVLIHELAHRDHFAAMRESGGSAGAMDKFRDWTGRLEETPDGVRPTVNPWGPGFASRPTGLDAGEAKEIAKAVSNYAATNPLEFVAEVRTSIAAGNRHSRRVMDLYRSYLGPETPVADSPVAEAA